MHVQVPPAADPIKKYLYDTIAGPLKPFEREFVFYRELEPGYRALCTDRGQDPLHLLDYVSRVFFIPRQGGGLEPLVLQDLTEEGYTMFEDELGGLDLAHTLEVMRALAKHHALGMAFIKNKGSQMENESFKDLLQPEFEALFTPETTNLYENALEFAINWTKERKMEEEAGKIMIIKENMMDRLRDLYKLMVETHPSTISHGDCRLNNFMFKYGQDGRTPTGVKIIDFQSWFQCPQSSELSYFLFSSVRPEVLIDDFEIIFDCYYNSFVGNLARLGCGDLTPDLPVLKDFFFKTCFLGFLIACMLSQIVFTGNPELEQSQKNERMENFMKVIRENMSRENKHT